ncbi:hypothetical protein [Bacteroides oleiciplenus]|uniref:TRAFAC clade GTPase domain-containing protein n=1 Tax=Bacteroides oleiciplenus TaxID=626931 RepID=UPI0026DB2DD9|nr:hypothetical protein [Bacteroides oleiciplenus]
MNILMVGHSRSGKTSFMAGMYKYLGDDKSGYGIRAKNATQKRHLQRMAEQLSYGKYPTGTDVQQMYNFELTCLGEDIIPFNWMDYRGGILLSDDPDDEDMNKFLKAIKTADALVVFLDGEKLSDNSGRWTMEYDILLSCIENSLDVDHQSWFPICFVITKCDMLPDGIPFHGLNRFHTLFNQISDSKKVGAMLVQCSINSQDYFTPFLALAYCIYGGTPIYIQKRLDSMMSAANRAKQHRPETLIGWLAAGTEQLLSGAANIIDCGWQTELDKAESANWDYEKEQKQLEKLQAIAEELEEKLKQWSNDDMVTFF